MPLVPCPVYLHTKHEESSLIPSLHWREAIFNQYGIGWEDRVHIRLVEKLGRAVRVSVTIFIVFRKNAHPPLNMVKVILFWLYCLCGKSHPKAANAPTALDGKNHPQIPLIDAPSPHYEKTLFPPGNPSLERTPPWPEAQEGTTLVINKERIRVSILNLDPPDLLIQIHKLILTKSGQSPGRQEQGQTPCTYWWLELHTIN